MPAELQWGTGLTYLPVLGLPGQHAGVFGFGDLIIAIVLGLLDVLLGLNPLVLGEGAVVALLDGVSVDRRPI